MFGGAPLLGITYRLDPVIPRYNIVEPRNRRKRSEEAEACCETTGSSRSSEIDVLELARRKNYSVGARQMIVKRVFEP